MVIISRFAELNENVTYVAQLLINNNNLIKLIAHDENNPLEQSIINNPKTLLFDRIYPMPKVPDVLDSQKSIVSFVFSGGELDERNVKFKNYKLIFFIICHIDLWKINDGIRPYLIANEIDNIFNELRGTQLSVSRAMFDSWIYKEFNKNYCGYYQSYIISNLN